MISCESRKKRLINKLIKNPTNFNDTDLDRLFSFKCFQARDLRQILLRLFDINDINIKNESDASIGGLGYLNKRSQKKRHKKFWKKINSGYRAKSKGKVILAEGDSWFEFPIFIRDIIDYLIKDYGYAIYSLAHAGDWMSNILYEHEYIEELSRLNPDVFLVSGGGNDLVGGKRLAHLIKLRKNVVTTSSLDLTTKEGKLTFARACFKDEFYSLLKVYELQYKLLFHSIRNKAKDKFGNMKIITQGYDYAIPSFKKGFFVRWWINKRNKNGKWLKTPLLLNGYDNELEQQAIVYAMIEEFNKMLIKVGSKYDNVYHVDCRKMARRKDWFDELHYKSRLYRKVAKKYHEIIEKRKDP